MTEQTSAGAVYAIDPATGSLRAYAVDDPNFDQDLDRRFSPKGGGACNGVCSV